MNVTDLRTRKPTGKPSWPMLLLAGAEKSGKSYSAAVAASSPLVGCTYWVTIGEDDPDEYGQLGDFDIVEHDGTYPGILAAIRAAASQPAPTEGVPLLVVDSMTRLWDLLKDHAQDVANRRAAAKAKKANRPAPEEDAQITMDLWNAAADQWHTVMAAIRSFPGPVILTARLDVVAVMDDNGQPTKEKTTKVQAHKSLPYDAGAVIEMPQRGETWITGVRSVRMRLMERTRAPKNFTVDWFWRQLGLHEDETSTREHTAPRIVAAEPTDSDPAGTISNRPTTDSDRQKPDLIRSGRPQTPRPQKAQPLPAPTEEQRVAVAEFAEAISETATIAALRALRQDADQKGLLGVPTVGGARLNDVFHARKAELSPLEDAS